MSSHYVEAREGGLYLTGSRVSLASIIYEYREGAAAETIWQNFPTLSLEQIHGAIAYYLGHREQAEDYLRELDEKWDALEHAPETGSAEIRQRLDEGRRRLLTRQA